MGRPGSRFRNKLYVFMIAITTTIINLLITSGWLGGRGGWLLVYIHLTVATAD